MYMLLAQVNFDNPHVFAPARISSIGTLMNLIIPLLLLGAALLFLIMGLMAGFNILTGGDNPDQIKKAQQSLGFSVLGIIIVICSFLAVKLISMVLGVNNALP